MIFAWRQTAGWVSRKRLLIKRTLSLAVFLAAAAIPLLAAGSANQTFIGVITDDMCPTGDHSQMRMGSDDAECTRACVSVHGAAYVLYDGKKSYALSDQKSPEAFAGQKVKITGILEAKTKNTIQVKSVVALK